PAHRHQDLGDHAGKGGRGGGDGVLRGGDRGVGGGDGRPHSGGGGGADGGRRRCAGGVALHADQGPDAGRVLPRVPGEPLVRVRAVRGDGGGVRALRRRGSALRALTPTCEWE